MFALTGAFAPGAICGVQTRRGWARRGKVGDPVMMIGDFCEQAQERGRRTVFFRTG